MIKRKTVFTAVVIGAGVIAVIDRIKLLARLMTWKKEQKISVAAIMTFVFCRKDITKIQINR